MIQARRTEGTPPLFLLRAPIIAMIAGVVTIVTAVALPLYSISTAWQHQVTATNQLTAAVQDMRTAITDLRAILQGQVVLLTAVQTDNAGIHATLSAVEVAAGIRDSRIQAIEDYLRAHGNYTPTPPKRAP